MKTQLLLRMFWFKSKKVEVLLSELQWKDDIRSISAGPPFVPAYPLIASLHHL